MPDNLTDYEEVRLLDLSWQNTDQLALLSVQGTDSAIGTEITGGGYARATLAASAASTTSGVSTKVNSGSITIATPDTDCQGWALFDSTGAFRKWFGFWARTLATAQASGDTITATGHGRADTQKIVFQAGYTPAGLTANTTYYVRDSTANTFKVAAAPGGSAIDITADSSSVTFGNVVTLTTAGAVVAPGAIVIGLS